MPAIAHPDGAVSAAIVLVHGLCGFDRLVACRRPVKEYFPALRDVLGAIAGPEPVTIVIDKQGGRNFYAPWVSTALPDGWVMPIHESRHFFQVVWRQLVIVSKQYDQFSFGQLKSIVPCSSWIFSSQVMRSSMITDTMVVEIP